MHCDCGDLPHVEGVFIDVTRSAGQGPKRVLLRYASPRLGLRRQTCRRPRMAAVVTPKAGAWIINVSASVSMSHG
jgi:hypothetical protein